MPCKVVACIPLSTRYLDPSLLKAGRCAGVRGPRLPSWAGLKARPTVLQQELISKAVDGLAHMLSAWSRVWRPSRKFSGPGRSPYRITLQTHVSVIKPKCQGLTNGAGPCEAFTPKQVSLQCPRCRMYLAIYVTAKCERTESGGEGWTRTNRPSWWSQTEEHGFVRDLDRVLQVTPPRRSTAELLPKKNRK